MNLKDPAFWPFPQVLSPVVNMICIVEFIVTSTITPWYMFHVCAGFWPQTTYIFHSLDHDHLNMYIFSTLYIGFVSPLYTLHMSNYFVDVLKFFLPKIHITSLHYTMPLLSSNSLPPWVYATLQPLVSWNPCYFTLIQENMTSHHITKKITMCFFPHAFVDHPLHIP